MKMKLIALSVLALGLAGAPAVYAQNATGVGGAAGSNGSDAAGSVGDAGNGSGGIAPADATGQDSGTTSSTSHSGGGDAAEYLSGPNIQSFYKDNNEGTWKSADEMKSVWSNMSADEQANLRNACSTNQDAKFNDLCTNVNAM